jgi:hypothetical protein
MRASRASKLYGLATLCVVLITVLVDWLYFADENIDVIDYSPVHAAHSQQLTELMTQKSHEPKSEALTPTKYNDPQITHLAFVEITLPAPQVAQKTALPAKTFMTMQNSSQVASHTKSSTQPSKVEIKQRLNQLVALKGSERSLYFPESSTKQILEYMHSCIGIDVGAVKDNKLTVFSHKNRRHSEIVRVANGYRTEHEQVLLDIYAPNQTLVRLYPISFDETLGKSIAQYLGATPLTQLSGQYALRRNSLWLTNVSVNQKSISGDWQLSKGC